MTIQCLFILLCLGQLFAMNVLAGEDGWTVMKQEVYLSDFTSSSFWKGSLPPYRESQNESSEPSESPSSIHSLEDDEVEAQVGGEMVISTSLANLNI